MTKGKQYNYHKLGRQTHFVKKASVREQRDNVEKVKERLER